MREGVMKRITSFAAAALMVGWSSFAGATTYELNYSNVFGYYDNYATVDVNIDNNYILSFVVTANSSYFTAANNKGLAWDKFAFNFSDNVTATLFQDASVQVGESWTALSSSGFAFLVQEPPSENGTHVSEFGLFEAYEHDPGSFYNPLIIAIDLKTMGEGYYELLTVGDFAVQNENGGMFAGHLRNFKEIEGQTSTFLGDAAPVPEPGTVLLFGTGLAGLAAVGRRRKN